MREQNDGIGEDSVLRNQFTAYMVTAIRNCKTLYIQQKIRVQSFEFCTETAALYTDILPDEELLIGLSVMEQIEDYRLHLALVQAKERELYILFSKVLYDQSFAGISRDLGMRLKTVASIYYRLIGRLREEIRGGV